MTGSASDLADLIFGTSDGVNSLQMSARAMVVLVYGLAVVRIFGRRIFGRWSPLDVILSVLIGSNLSRTLTANAPLLETIVATTVLIAVFWLLARLSLWVDWIGWLVKGHVVKLIGNGEVDWGQMRRQGLGPGDLDEALRSSGVEQPEQVREAWLERNGDINVIRR